MTLLLVNRPPARCSAHNLPALLCSRPIHNFIWGRLFVGLQPLLPLAPFQHCHPEKSKISFPFPGASFLSWQGWLPTPLTPGGEGAGPRYNSRRPVQAQAQLHRPAFAGAETGPWKGLGEKQFGIREVDTEMPESWGVETGCSREDGATGTGAVLKEAGLPTSHRTPLPQSQHSFKGTPTNQGECGRDRKLIKAWTWCPRQGL